MLAVLDEYNFGSGSQLIIGEDFNLHLDAELDNSGGRIEKKSSVKKNSRDFLMTLSTSGVLEILTKNNTPGDKNARRATSLGFLVN